jgi:hypothetical protein
MCLSMRVSPPWLEMVGGEEDTAHARGCDPDRSKLETVLLDCLDLGMQKSIGPAVARNLFTGGISTNSGMIYQWPTPSGR